MAENIPHVGGSQQGEGTPSEEERTVSEESAEKEESNAGDEHPLFNAKNELAVPESKDHSIIAVLPSSNTPTSINPAHAEPPTDPNNDPFPSSLITEPPLSELDLVNAP